MTDTVDEWLRAVPEPERELADAVLGLVRETVSEAEEAVKWNNPCFSIAGSTACTSPHNPATSTSGSSRGRRSTTRRALLERTGEAMRHVKVRSVEALADPALSALVRAAANHAHQ